MTLNKLRWLKYSSLPELRSLIIHWNRDDLKYGSELGKRLYGLKTFASYHWRKDQWGILKNQKSKCWSRNYSNGVPGKMVTAGTVHPDVFGRGQ